MRHRAPVIRKCFWNNEWASEMFFAMATSTLKVSRSYYPKLKIEIEHQSQSEDGRFLVFQILVNVHR